MLPILEHVYIHGTDFHASCVLEFTQSDEEQLMSLMSEIEAKRHEIRTDGYAMSIGEWMSLYENDEIDIHPEFQRFYRWTSEQKTRLVESILLGIPIPSIFVSQREDGVWDVVDGLQRLSTIYEVVGILKEPDGSIRSPLLLEGTKYLPSLKNSRWSRPKSGEKEIPPELKLAIKRSKLNVSIIEKESDPNAKYDLFQRLNTGGSALSDQEVRNCLMVMVNPEFFRWVENLAKDQNFQLTIALSERPISESYDVELVVRFLLFATSDEKSLNSIGDVGKYITEKIVEVAQNKKFEKKKWESLFKKSFAAIAYELEDSAFKRYDVQKERFMGGFSLSAYEAIAYGVAYHINAGTDLNDLRKAAKDLWQDKIYKDWTGAGITAARRLPKIIPAGRRIVGQAA